MCHGPLRSTTCSTRVNRSPPSPFLPSLARTPACLPTDLLHSRLPSSSHRSPDVLHSQDSLSLPFSLYLASTGACPPTDRPNDATTASLLAPSEVSSSFSTCFNRLTHASTVPALAHLQVGVSTFPSFKPHFSPTGPPTAPQLPTPAAFHQSTLPRFLSVYSLLFRATLHCRFPALSRNWSPGYVTKTKSGALNRSFC